MVTLYKELIMAVNHAFHNPSKCSANASSPYWTEIGSIGNLRYTVLGPGRGLAGKIILVDISAPWPAGPRSGVTWIVLYTASIHSILPSLLFKTIQEADVILSFILKKKWDQEILRTLKKDIGKKCIKMNFIETWWSELCIIIVELFHFFHMCTVVWLTVYSVWLIFKNFLI